MKVRGEVVAVPVARVGLLPALAQGNPIVLTHPRAGEVDALLTLHLARQYVRGTTLVRYLHNVTDHQRYTSQNCEGKREKHHF